jgi:starch-binding outer membrane protein, SusD/RagB family
MIKLRSIYFVLLCVTALSCRKESDFLDKKTVTDLNEQTTFSDSARTMNFLVGIYSDIGFSASPSRFESRSGVNVASDEAEGYLIGGNQWHVRFANAVINPLIIPEDAWTTSYANIRRANVFLRNLPNAPLSAGLKSRVAGEARFLRAWYYSIMLTHYGGIPLIGDTLYSATDNISGKRNTYEECVNYIVSECDALAQILPAEHELSLNYGRITKGACLALKARVLLYAASPLFNGGSLATSAELKAITSYPTFDRERWKLAADAAKAVMDMNQYELYVDNTTAPGYGFQKVFSMRVNPEYILAQMRPPNKDLENIWDPPSRGATGGVFPYQELVDAFDMNNGEPAILGHNADGTPIINTASGYDPANPYVNRDPRFAYTVLFNEGLRLDRVTMKKEKVYTYNDYLPDGYPTGTRTGYYTMKMLDENTIQPINAPNTQRCLPLIRYAEILLNRAEALNEYEGPTPEVYALVEEIRERAGLNPYQLPAGLTQQQMRERIRNERRVELAFESHRFWDVRRWKIAEQTDNRMLHGMKITKSGSTYSYTVVDVRRHTFTPAMYLWPIPQSEMSKSSDLLQNPLW